MPLDRPRVSRYCSPTSGRSRSRIRHPLTGHWMDCPKTGVAGDGEVDRPEFPSAFTSSRSSSERGRGRVLVGQRHHSRDSLASLRIRPRPLSPPFSSPYGPRRGLCLSPTRSRFPGPRSPREWPSTMPGRSSGFRGQYGESPPLLHSLAGRPSRSSRAASAPGFHARGSGKVRAGLPPGVVVFPSGNMLATASVAVINKEDLRHTEFKITDTNDLEEGKEGSSPAIRGRSQVVKIEVVPRPYFTDEDLIRLEAHFKILRPRFPVRCKYKACATLRGPLRELWCNMITVPGKSLLYFESLF